MYSNEDIEAKAIPYLWENFDKEGWSFWRADYKYNDELKMGFMASNLIGGMFQRLEKLHKYAFASVLIFGEDYKLTISGIWLLRGHQLSFDVSSYTRMEVRLCVCVYNPLELPICSKTGIYWALW